MPLCRVLAALWLTVGLGLGAAPAASDAATPTAGIPADLAARVGALMPSVAVIKIIVGTPQGSQFFEGAGFVVDPAGLIATNRHVVAGAYDISVLLPDRPPLTGKVVYASPLIDLAILKVDTDKPLPAVKLGDSNTVQIGDPVLLIGNPLGIGRSLSTGVISALNRNIGETMYDHFFQTDGALNHGNSGGPMFNLDGEVIAINTALTSSPGNTGSIGIGYALPINDAKFVINQFLKTGEVHVSTAGVRGQRVTKELAEAFGLGSVQGAIVTEVDPKGPAFGKIRDGDIILTVNDQDASDTAAVARLIAATPAGQSLRVRLQRDGKEQTLVVPVVPLPDDPRYAMSIMGHAPAERMAFATPSRPGLEFAAITAPMRSKYRLEPDEHGVVVTAVAEDSAAARRGVTEGQVIEAVGDHAVREPGDVRRGLQSIVNQHRMYAPLLVRGAEGPHWVVLMLEADH